VKLHIPRIAAGLWVLLERSPSWRERFDKKNKSANDLIYCVRRVFLEEQTSGVHVMHQQGIRSIVRINTCLQALQQRTGVKWRIANEAMIDKWF
jgi:hypothetical protein